MYSHQPGANTPAHDYDAQYQPQSTDDRFWDDGFTKQPVPRKRPNYKPTPLRWPYIASLIIFIMAIMGLVVWARISMPKSDTTAHIQARREELKLEVRTESDGAMNANALATTVFVSHVSSTVTVGATTGKFTTMVPTTIFTTKFAEPTTIIHPGTTVTTWEQATYTSAIVTDIVKTMTGSVTEIVKTSWSVGNTMVQATGTVAASAAFSIPVPYTETTTMAGSVVTEHSTLTTKIVASSAYTSLVPGSTQEVQFSDEITSAIATSAVASVGTTTKAASTFITLGEVTITSVYTDPDYAKNNPPDKPTAKPTAKVVDVVSVEPDKTDKKVEKLNPVTYVSKVGGVETVVVSAGAVETVVSVIDGQSKPMVITHGVQTIVSDVEGYVTTMDMTTYGEDGLPTTAKITSSVSGFRTTMISSVQPTTFVTTRSESLMTITSSQTGSTTIISTKKGKTKTYSHTTTVTPTAAESEPTAGIHKDTQVIKINEAQYFVGKFLPPFLSVLLSIPARIIDFNAQLYQPFYALNLPSGAFGPSSMNLHFGGWNSVAKPFTLLVEGQPVTFFTMLIVWITAAMTPIATEAIGVKMHGSCKTWDPRGCAAALGVSPNPTRTLLALLALLVVLLCLLLFFLRNWETGLHANPWSVVGIASLATNREVRPQKSTERKIAKEMIDKRFGFGYFENDHGQTEYGIVLYDDAGQNLRQQDITMGSLSEASSLDMTNANRIKRRGNPFMALGLAWRLGFLVFLLGLMAMILFYAMTFKKQNDFQNFMTGQTFGIRFLFAALGVIISFAWTTLFISVAMIMPYKAMHASPQSPTDSILLTRPTNPFSGFWSSIQRRQFFLAVIALMTIFSEFMPILLANVPYTLTQTQDTHNVCLRLSVAILGLMVLAVTASFFIKWPFVPVDPRSIAGAMYYVSQSAMLDQFSGMASLDNHERRRRVQELGGRYWYGDIVTHAGVTRPAVERDDGVVHTHDSKHAAHPEMQHNFNMNVDTAYQGAQHTNNDAAYQGHHQGDIGTATTTYHDQQHDIVSPIAEPTYNGQYHEVVDADITTAHYAQHQQAPTTNVGTGDCGHQETGGPGANATYYGQQYDLHGQQYDPHGQQYDPHGQQYDPHGQQHNLHGQQYDPAGTDTNMTYHGNQQ